MDHAEKKQLALTACEVRKGIIEGVFNAKSGHPGGSLSIADVLTYLYEKELRVDPKNPKKEDRDRLVLSKGHAAPALYAILAEEGFFPKEDLKTLRKPDSYLQGHPNMNYVPGVDMSTGSLGQGISAAVGMALASKLQGEPYRVYCIVGDGELGEGQVWEAAMFAAAKHLNTLTVFVDNNNLQIDGTIEEVNSPYPIPEKFEAFGFKVMTINGHDFDEIEAAVNAAKQETEKPTAIIMETIKGKGVSYMENAVGWHGSAPNAEQYAAAMEELNACSAALKAE